MNKVIALAVTALVAAAASPSFAGTVDLMHAYWIGH